MFTLTKSQDLRGVITEAYTPGGAHIEKWLNAAGSGIQGCIDDQVQALSVDPTMVLYRVNEDEKFVGYFGRSEDGTRLHTIFIVPEFRPRKSEFFQHVRSEMLPTFFVGGFLKNVPACTFYRKMGAEQIDTLTTDAGPGILFRFTTPPQKVTG